MKIKNISLRSLGLGLFSLSLIFGGLLPVWGEQEHCLTNCSKQLTPCIEECSNHQHCLLPCIEDCSYNQNCMQQCGIDLQICQSKCYIAY